MSDTALQREAGYQEISYGPGDLSGVDSWRWIFRISGDERIDYFFSQCTSDFGVLGSTIPSRFNQLLATFKAVAESVQATCQ